MQQDLDFCVLSVRPDDDLQRSFQILVVFYPSLPPSVMFPPNWQQLLNPDDQEYIEELVKDWRQTAPLEAPALFEELSDLSFGILQTLRTGKIDELHIEVLAQEIASRKSV